MFHSHQRREGLSAAIFSLWRNWTIAIGFLAILSFVSPLIRQVWLAPVCIVLFLALQLIRSAMNNQPVPVCSRLYKEVSVIILVITCIVLLRYFITGGNGAFELTGQPVNTNGPLLGILISAPVTAVVTACFLLQKREPLVCQLCHLRYGNVVKNGFIGMLYHREWRYQTRLLMVLSLLLGVVDWTYYLFHYINVNLNRADYFFFLWLPLALYVISLLYLGWRYYSLWVFYCHNDEGHVVTDPSSTTVRFLVISDDMILLDIRRTDKFFNNGAVIKRFDTPAVATLPYQERYDAGRAAELFKQITGISGAEIRPMYDSPDNVTYRNIFHFFAFIDNKEDITESKIHGEWFSLGELRQLMMQHLTGNDLNSEMARIYRIAMAWKTYDREGRRLYKFKHYRPTFRIKDIRNWEVDYNDGHWLSVGRLNEDSRLFRLRRFLKRIEDKIRRNTPMMNLFT